MSSTTSGLDSSSNFGSKLEVVLTNKSSVTPLAA